MTTTTASPARPAAFYFVVITVALDMLAIGIIIPVLPKLIEHFLDGNTVRAAKYVGLFSMLFAGIQFLVSPILGALSDRFGRRPVILMSNLGLGLDYIVMALAPTLPWLFLGRAIAGVTSASVSTAGAYIADVTPPEQRAAKFGMLGAAFGFGFVIGPAIGGMLGSYDLHYPFWAAAAMSLLNFSYGFFVLPESLKPENRSKFSWLRANPVGSLLLLISNRQLWSFGSAIFFSQLAHTVLPAVFVLYAGYRYGWGPWDVGLVLAAVGVASVSVQGGLVKPFVKKLGERKAAILGLVCGAAALAWYGTAWTGPLVWIGVPVAAMWGLFNATSQSIMSKNVTALEQGKLQGANTSILALANMTGPWFFTYAFADSIDPRYGINLPGIPFWCAAGFLGVAALITIFVTRPMEKLASEKTP
jgi:MFS transporter, DHA1 family, tetracycline resistance protein